MAESEEELKSLLMKIEEESGKAGLKLNIQRTKIMASGPHNFMASRWGNNENSETAAMKLKDACSFEEKLWQTLEVY